MSKYLTKILSICAFVIVLPLAILGTALCVTETKDYKLTLNIVGVEDNAFASADLNLNDLPYTEPVTFRKNTQVKVSVVGAGYDVAWYAGDYETQTTPLSNDLSFNYKVVRNETLTAVVKLKEYTVNYTNGKNADNSVFANLPKQYKYGQKLATPTDEDFMYWTIDGQSTDITNKVDYATFDSSAVTLRANWGEEIEVVYHYGSNQTWTQRLFKQLVSVVGNFVKVDSIPNYTVPVGYTAEWVSYTDHSKTLEDVIRDYSTGKIELYLKEEAINYTVNVQFNAKDTDNVKVMTATAGKLGQYPETTEAELPARPGYKFVGLTYDGVTTYTWNGSEYANGAETLQSVITENADDQNTITLTAVWQSEYTTVSIKFQGFYQNFGEGRFVEADGVRLDGTHNNSIALQINDGQHGYSLNQTLAELLNERYSTFTYQGHNVQLAKGYKVNDGGATDMNADINNTTLYQMLQTADLTSDYFADGATVIIQLIFVDAQ